MRLVQVVRLPHGRSLLHLPPLGRQHAGGVAQLLLQVAIFTFQGLNIFVKSWMQGWNRFITPHVCFASRVLHIVHIDLWQELFVRLRSCLQRRQASLICVQIAQ